MDDYDLYKTFKDRYPSTKGAKVVLEPNGDSRGFGFVRFSNSIERNAALRVSFYRAPHDLLSNQTELTDRVFVKVKNRHRGGGGGVRGLGFRSNLLGFGLGIRIG